jgi:hypothetical protein
MLSPRPGHRVERLFLRQALLVGLGAGHPHSHHEAVAYLGADIGDHFAQEAQAALGIAAVGIVTQIDARIQELRRQVAVAGDDLHPVQSCGLHAPRRIAIALHDGVDHALLQRTRHDVKALVRNRGGRVGHVEQPAVRFGHFTARVK